MHRLFCILLQISDFLKQLVSVWFEIASHAFLSMYIAKKKENFGIGSFFSNAKIRLVSDI